MFGYHKSIEMPRPEEALPGRAEAMPVPARHAVLGTPLAPPYPATCAIAWFGMGCFWGAERRFWLQDGVYATAVGYAGGHTPTRRIAKCVPVAPGIPRSCR